MLILVRGDAEAVDSLCCPSGWCARSKSRYSVNQYVSEGRPMLIVCYQKVSYYHCIRYITEGAN
jgi:hypothetical protein